MSWEDFLGSQYTKRTKRVWVPFEEARSRVHKLGLRNVHDWSLYFRSSSRDHDIPCNPQDVYPEWAGWGDFLGGSYVNKNKDKVFQSYSDARTFAHTLGLDCRKAWEMWIQRERGELPNDIPINPRLFYGRRGCWKGWADFLGQEKAPKPKKQNNKQYISYEQARELAQRVGVRNSSTWQRWYESMPRAPNIPAHPDSVYRTTGEWTTWKAFLGSNYGPSDDRYVRTYKEARKFARLLHLDSESEWHKWCKDRSLPCTIPRHPDQVGSWISIEEHDGPKLNSYIYDSI